MGALSNAWPSNSKRSSFGKGLELEVPCLDVACIDGRP